MISKAAPFQSPSNFEMALLHKTRLYWSLHLKIFTPRNHSEQSNALSFISMTSKLRSFAWIVFHFSKDIFLKWSAQALEYAVSATFCERSLIPWMGGGRRFNTALALRYLCGSGKFQMYRIGSDKFIGFCGIIDGIIWKVVPWALLLSDRWSKRNMGWQPFAIQRAVCLILSITNIQNSHRWT